MGCRLPRVSQGSVLAPEDAAEEQAASKWDGSELREAGWDVIRGVLGDPRALLLAVYMAMPGLAVRTTERCELLAGHVLVLWETLL